MSGKLPKIPKMELPKVPKMPKINIVFLQLIKQGQDGFRPLVEPGRPMKFPYTFSAKIAQFPYKFYFKNNWISRYYPLGVLGSLPVFWVCHRLANSKENKTYWKELRRKEKEEAHNKFL